MLRFSFPPAFLFVCFLAQVPNYSGTYCQSKPNTLTPKSFRPYLRRLLRRGSRSNGPCALVNVFFFFVFAALPPQPQRDGRAGGGRCQPCPERLQADLGRPDGSSAGQLHGGVHWEANGAVSIQSAKARSQRRSHNPPLRAAQLGAVIAFYRTAVYFKRNRASNCIKPPTSFPRWRPRQARPPFQEWDV